MIGDFDDMRFSLATASCAVVIGALLAGCSTSGMQAAGPSASTSIVQLSTQKVSNTNAHPNHTITPLKQLELEVSGRIPGQATHKALVKMLQQLKQHSHRNVVVHRDGAKTITNWTDDTDYGYLLGQNKKNVTVTAVSTESAGCYDPITVKVDHSQHVWVSCESNSSFTGGAETEYGKTGAEMGEYAWSDPYTCNYSTGCEFQFDAGFDGAGNSSYTFSELSYNEQYLCSTSCYYSFSNPGFFYWPTGSPSSSATFIQVPVSAGVEEIYYMDLDASGNIWFDYQGTSGVGIGEVKTPTTSPTFVNVLPSSGIGFPGGVYVSNGGATLNVTDQDSRITTQYAISGSTLAETGTIGPTMTNAEGLGDPVSGGFNKADSMIGFGDAYGFVDTCTTASVCKDIGNPNLPYGAEGFAYTPSDK